MKCFGKPQKKKNNVSDEKDKDCVPLRRSKGQSEGPCDRQKTISLDFSNGELSRMISSSEKNEKEIVETLEKYAGQPNFDIDKSIFDGHTLLHVAAVHGKPNVLESLLKLGADVNKKNNEEDTPVIIVLKKCNECDIKELLSYFNKQENKKPDDVVCYSHMRCFKILLKQNNVDLQAVNINGLSAMSYATMNHNFAKREKYIKLLLNLEEKEDCTCNLYRALQGKLDSQFVMELNTTAQKIGKSNLLKFMYKNFTLLQILCKFGMLESAKRLVEMGADVHFAPIMRQRPIQIACRFAQVNILEFLIAKHAHFLPNQERLVTKNNRNLFHQTVKSFANSKQSHKCLKILLKNKQESCSIGDVNDQDDHGRSPLHYAVAHENEPCIIELLENGALIDKEDNWKRTPLMHISAATFKKYLNNMISGNRREPDNLCTPGDTAAFIERKRFRFRRNEEKTRRAMREEETAVDLIVNFETLFRKERGNLIFPTDFLRDIKKVKRLRKIIGHPVFSLIIFFKWWNIRLAFYAYLFLYLLFCIMYTFFVLVRVDKQNKFSHNQTDPIQPEPHCEASSAAPITLNTLLSIFALLEIFKMIGDLKKYVINLDNIIRVIVITLSFMVLQCLSGCSSSIDYCPQIEAISILITWLELFLVIGKHPKLSFHVTTFRSASLGLFRFLIVHGVLLIGFALSFHTLFRSNSNENIFTNPWYSAFKTIVMLTSEFDAGEIPFSGYTGISHVIFIAYIFIATIVLFNLMIGLAFSKVNEMEKNPFLYESLAQIDIITHFEDYFFNSALRRRFNSFKCCKQSKEKVDTKKPEEICPVPKILIQKDNKLQTFLKFETEGKIKVIEATDKRSRQFLNFINRSSTISEGILEKARKIVSNKMGENEESKEETINLNAKLDAIANELVGIKNAMDEMKELQKDIKSNM